MMDRRAFIERIFFGLAMGGLFLAAGCGRKEQKVPTLGNEEKLWRMAATQQKFEEPLDLAYAKGTPAFFRDASLGKADPNFKPKIGGG
jgi:hypothetical protein